MCTIKFFACFKSLQRKTESFYERIKDSLILFLFCWHLNILFELISLDVKMTQNITIQIGQCGNQIGCRFWDLALREHANLNKKGVFDEALSTFFRNVEVKALGQQPEEIPVGKGHEKIRSLRARAVLVDTEESVVKEIMKGNIFALSWTWKQ